MTEPVSFKETPAPVRRRLGKAGVAAIAGTAVVTLGVGGFLATTAAFTDSKNVTGNRVRTASLQIGDVVTAPVSVDDLLPGQNADSADVIAFRNDGTVDFTYTVTLSGVTSDATTTAVNTKLLGWIPVTLTAGGQTVTGTLAAPPTLPATTLAVGGDADVDVRVGLDANADNDVQGLAAGFDLVVTANQIP